MNYTTKVFVKHWRVPYGYKGKGNPLDCFLVPYSKSNKDYSLVFYPATKGGKTEVTIQVFDEHGDPVTKFVGVANCSLKDNFCYKLGREIATGRAEKQLENWLNPEKSPSEY